MSALESGVTDSVKSTSARLSSLSKYLETLSTRISDTIPKNANLWVLLLLGLIVVVALSRMMSMQKSIQELQARPIVDEYLVRQVVRSQLEETVKSLDEQNKLQLQLRHEAAMNEARRRAEEHQARLREAQIVAQQQAEAQAQAAAAQAAQAQVVETVQVQQVQEPEPELVAVAEVAIPVAPEVVQVHVDAPPVPQTPTPSKKRKSDSKARVL
jgi:hypothetical protein